MAGTAEYASLRWPIPEDDPAGAVISCGPGQPERATTGPPGLSTAMMALVIKVADLALCGVSRAIWMGVAPGAGPADR
jgi:hypothetical protein